MAGDIIFFKLAGPVGDYTGAQLRANCDLSRGFFYTLFSWQRSCDGLGGGRGHNMINMTIRELHCTFADIFTLTNLGEFSRGLYIILITPKGTAKLRLAGWGAEDTIFFRVPRSSLRVRRSSIGCSVVQKGAA
jgi:hypothetical protein